ncbi:MAG: hypothetical protein L0206_20530, partial [Actinobacteria bacterium]|nr:hypothetical protein [Actinomycetota bacterium]
GRLHARDVQLHSGTDGSGDLVLTDGKTKVASIFAENVDLRAGSLDGSDALARVDTRSGFFDLESESDVRPRISGYDEDVASSPESLAIAQDAALLVRGGLGASPAVPLPTQLGAGIEGVDYALRSLGSEGEIDIAAPGEGTAGGGEFVAGSRLTLEATREVRINDDLVGEDALESLDVVRGTTFIAEDVTTEGPQRYRDAVRLGGSTESPRVLTAGTAEAPSSVTFEKTVDSVNPEGEDPFQPRSLRVAATTTAFVGDVGAQRALDMLETTLTDPTDVTTITGDVTTEGSQTYGDAVTLDGGAQLLTGSEVAANGALTLAGTAGTTKTVAAGTATLGSTVDGDRALQVNAGTTSFVGNVGGTTALTSLETDAAGTTAVAGNVRTTGTQTYGDSVTLGGGAQLLTGSEVAANGALTLAGTAGTTKTVAAGTATFG